MVRSSSAPWREALSHSQLDQGHVDYFSQYRSLYFNESFREGQGTEEILELIAALDEVGCWLDLGCGPTTLFWSIPANVRSSIDCCDKSAEALKVLYDFILSDEIPPCYQQVLTRYGRDRSYLAGVRDKIDRFIVHDVLNTPLCGVLARQHELITAIGLFGLSRNPERYAWVLGNAAAQLADEGYMIGADWVRSARFIGAEGHDNSYINEALIRDAAGEHRLDVLSLSKIRIRDDPLYSTVFVWLMRGK
ncbi:hypothetical protein [Bradyrhizobium arachidis]|uniref:hypothetical protein n=1 Tax=Bradyrhizobium arachidis TaxID=858423 RepID=UPI002162AE2F|nr:hypothetical protein [Bradyrhizobium arachidis]UVO30151.1 hypothetical protein KUF59_05125 [Bradyrhizobium arachidis]